MHIDHRGAPIRALVAVLALVLGLAALACGDDDLATATATPHASSTATTAARTPRVVHIGVVQSLTGAGDNYGPEAIAGIELAVKQVNQQSATTGIAVEYTVIDDGSSVEGARAAFATLIAKKVDAIIGPTLSGVAPESHRLAQEAGIPVLGATTTAAGITDVGDYVFRIALPESVVVPATLARVARETPVQRAVLVLDSNEAFSRSSAAAMRAGIAAQGGTIVAEVDLARAAAVEVVALREVPIDVFLVTPLVDTAVPVLQAIRGAGFTQPIVGGNSFNTLDIARLAGAAVEGAYVGAAWNPGQGGTASKAFVQAFTAQFGHAPDQFAAQGYTSGLVVFDALKRASAKTPSALRDALAATRNLDTPLGPLSMSERREAVHQPVTQQYRAGQLVVVP
jgi:branched-chain amino acid transport system substrate-binding protein